MVVLASGLPINRQAGRTSDVPKAQRSTCTSRRCITWGVRSTGYTDGTFKPNNYATRGQAAKIISKSAGFSDPPANQLFQDVPSDRASSRTSSAGESRDRIRLQLRLCRARALRPAGQPPIFHPLDTTTRGQVEKIVANTFFPNCEPPLGGNER